MAGEEGWREWLALEDRFYRRFVVCRQPAWPKTVVEAWDSCLLSAAASGGPVALCGELGWRLELGLELFSGCGRRLLLTDAEGGGLKLRTAMTRVLAMGWDRQDVLTVVQSDASVTRFALDGKVMAEFSLAEGEVLFDAAVTEGGQAVMRTMKGKIWLVSEVGGGQRAVHLVPTEVFMPPSKEAIRIDKTFRDTIAANGSSDDGSVLVFATCAYGMLAMATVSKAEWLSTDGDVLCNLSLSPNGTLLAACTSKGDVWVLKTDPLELIVESRLSERVPSSSSYPVSSSSGGGKEGLVLPKQLAWCGNHAVAVLYNSTIVLVGPSGSSVSYPLQTGGFLVTECDGVRIFTSKSIDFFELVPSSVEKVFGVGSTDPASVLFYSVEGDEAGGGRLGDATDSTVNGGDQKSESTASQEHALQRHAAIELLREDGQIIHAAECCLEAARHEWDFSVQKSLLRAASYGFAFEDLLSPRKKNVQNSDNASSNSSSSLKSRNDNERRQINEISQQPQEQGEQPSRDIDFLPRIATTLRVLNTSRQNDIGVLITADELEDLSVQRLVDRISALGQDKLALRLAIYTGSDPETILARWVTRFIHENGYNDDHEFARRCIDQFDAAKCQFPTLRPPYVVAAKAAMRIERFGLAYELLRLEGDPRVRVPLLSEMNLGTAALADAMESHSFDLLWEVFRKLRRTQTVRSIVSNIKRDLAPAVAERAVMALATILQREGNRVDLIDLHEEMQHYRELFSVELEAIFQVPGTVKRAEEMESLAFMIQKSPRLRYELSSEVDMLRSAAKVAVVASDLERTLSFPRGVLAQSASADLLGIAASASVSPARRKQLTSSIQKELKVDRRLFCWVCLEAMADKEDFEGMQDLAQSQGDPPPIGYMPFVNACLRRKNIQEAINYARRIVDGHDRARALAQCGNGKEAIEFASRTRNAQFLEEIQTLLISAQKQL